MAIQKTKKMLGVVAFAATAALNETYGLSLKSQDPQGDEQQQQERRQGNGLNLNPNQREFNPNKTRTDTHIDENERKEQVELLHDAILSGDQDFVKQLLANPRALTYINSVNRFGLTALIYASFHGYKEIVEMLIKQGADVNARPNHGETALTYAKKYKYEKIVEVLKAKLALDKRIDNLFSIKLKKLGLPPQCQPNWIL